MVKINGKGWNLESKKESDDVILYENDKYVETFCFLRQQTKKDKNNLCLSDYISDKQEDYMGESFHLYRWS